ncbi:MAG: hypothetical protein K2P95_01090, partial [Hyphomonadaceae bacterium]|nr:hypothetical protein [Hyphomonadaceae bacterium]
MANTPPDGPDRYGKSLAALGVAGASLAVAGGAWALREPLAEAVLEAAFRAQGVSADLSVRRVALTEIVIGAFTLGEKGAGLAGAEARIGLRWRGLLPEVASVELNAPRLRAAIEENGALRAGGLERLLKRVQPGAAPAPRLVVRGADGALQTPFGQLLVQGDAEGVPGERFTAQAQWRFGALAGPATVEATAAGT